LDEQAHSQEYEQDDNDDNNSENENSDDLELTPNRSLSENEAPSNIGLSDLNLRTVLSLITTILECSRAGLSAQNFSSNAVASNDANNNNKELSSQSPPTVPVNHPEILLKLETTAVLQGLRCLYKLYAFFYPNDPKVYNHVLDAEALAMRRTSSEPGKWKHVGNLVLNTVIKIEDDEDFKKRVRRLHPYFCKLVAHQFASEVCTPMRINLKDYFERVGRLAGITQ